MEIDFCIKSAYSKEILIFYTQKSFKKLVETGNVNNESWFAGFPQLINILMTPFQVQKVPMLTKEFFKNGPKNLPVALKVQATLCRSVPFCASLRPFLNIFLKLLSNSVPFCAKGNLLFPFSGPEVLP